jgi:hypothetical protein
MLKSKGTSVSAKSAFSKACTEGRFCGNIVVNTIHAKGTRATAVLQLCVCLDAVMCRALIALQQQINAAHQIRKDHKPSTVLSRTNNKHQDCGAWAKHQQPAQHVRKNKKHAQDPLLQGP